MTDQISTATILKITGLAFGPGTTIPTGTRLQAVTLVTSDPDTGPVGLLGLDYDTPSLSTGEAARFTIDGVTVLTTVPAFHFTTLRTDAGDFRAAVFTEGGDTYVLPRLGLAVAEASLVTGASAVFGSGGGIQTLEYGLLVPGAQVFAGNSFTVDGYTGTGTGRTGSVTVYDADGERGNFLAASDERLVGYSLADAREVIVVAVFADGSMVTGVRGLAVSRIVPYSLITTYLLDDAALAAAGRSIAEVVGVTGVGTIGHNLGWEELGLTLLPDGLPVLPQAPQASGEVYRTASGTALQVSAEAGVLANDLDADSDVLTATLASGPANGTLSFAADGSFEYRPDAGFFGTDSFRYTVSDGNLTSTTEVGLIVEVPADAPPNVINGTRGNDFLEGTDFADVIRTKRGALDNAVGGENDDYFVFGAEARNGLRERDVIYDFTLGEDSIVIEQGASIRTIRANNIDLIITLNGDRDTIELRNFAVLGLDPAEVEILFDAGVFRLG